MFFLKTKCISKLLHAALLLRADSTPEEALLIGQNLQSNGARWANSPTEEPSPSPVSASNLLISDIILLLCPRLPLVNCGKQPVSTCQITGADGGHIKFIAIDVLSVLRKKTGLQFKIIQWFSH